ncbi:MAG: ribosomal protein L7/L12 [Arenimonas sp.]
MSSENNELPDDVAEALQRSETIEAIKRLRAATGLGLKEAKDVIDDYVAGNTITVTSAHASHQFPDAVMQAFRNGNKIEAIKLLREKTGLGLKEAKDAIEALPQSSTSRLRNSPIETPRSGNGLLWLSGFVLLVSVAYYFYQQNR